jgi:hypothetical protein
LCAIDFPQNQKRKPKSEGISASKLQIISGNIIKKTAYFTPTEFSTGAFLRMQDNQKDVENKRSSDFAFIQL